MPDQPPAKRRATSAPLNSQPVGCYAELHCRTNFSFLEGASHPDELVNKAAELGLSALAITDRNSVSGVEPRLLLSMPRLSCCWQRIAKPMLNFRC
jgi:error-prone DNA polymerase